MSRRRSRSRSRSSYEAEQRQLRRMEKKYKKRSNSRKVSVVFYYPRSRSISERQAFKTAVKQRRNRFPNASDLKPVSSGLRNRNGRYALSFSIPSSDIEGINKLKKITAPIGSTKRIKHGDYASKATASRLRSLRKYYSRNRKNKAKRRRSRSRSK